MENSIDHIITRILSGNSSSEDFLSLSEWLNADEKNKKEFRRQAHRYRSALYAYGVGG